MTALAAANRLRRLDALPTAAAAVTAALPWLLLHSRALSEVGIDAVGALFLARCVVDAEWRWARQDWVILGVVWWGWVVACSAASGHGLVQGALLGRFLLFTAALQAWVLDARGRRWLLASLCAAAAYVAGQVLLQFTTGANLFGVPRYADGSLTGPFTKPRAGPSFVRLLFPPLLFAVGWLGARGTVAARAAAAALVVGAAAVMVLIGQRMPVLLFALGLATACLWLPRLRRLALVAVLAGAALIAASSVVAPPTFYRLVTKFSGQMEDFPASDYGLILRRALVIAGEHPWAGLGYDGYRTGCPDPGVQHGWHWPADPADTGGGADICVGHPHNHFLQALDDAGWPGLLLFCALLAAWLRRLGRGLWAQPDPLRVGLLVAFVIQEWPIASTSPLVSLPIGGWFFLLLGYGLALSPAPPPPTPP